METIGQDGFSGNSTYHLKMNACMHGQWLQSCLTLCNPMNSRPPGSSVHGILLTRILEWVAMPLFRGSSWPRDQTLVCCISCTAGRFFTIEPPGRPHLKMTEHQIYAKSLENWSRENTYNSFYKARIIQITNQTIILQGKITKTNILHGHICKNSKQNFSKI